MISLVRMFLCAGVGLAACWTLLANARTTGTVDETTSWKPILPDKEFRPLVEQAVKGIQEELAAASPTTKSANKARGLAVLIAVSAHSSLSRPGANTGELAMVQERALKLAEMVKQKKFAEAAKQAGALLGSGSAGKPTTLALPKLSDRDDLTAITMQLFALRTRGGLGLESKPAKNVDGIEARLVALSRKPLTPDDLHKQADEIVRAAYVSALIGEITHALAPEKDDGKKKRAEWIAWSEQMRDAGRQLAEAARATNPKEVRSAAVKLNASCTNCHEVYRSGE